MLLSPMLISLMSVVAARPGPDATVNESDKLLNQSGAHHVPFRFGAQEDGSMYYTDLDNLRDFMLFVRNYTQLRTLSDLDYIYERNLEAGKIQPEIPKSEEFPCANVSEYRSREIPQDIKQLRPGDIDIVAAFGDSVNAGSGIMALNAIGSIAEYRGLTFTGGGIESWRTVLTLPNILKVFNPQLYGYAVGHSLMADVKLARFIVAEPMLMLRDLPFQAHVLIKRLKNDPQVDMEKHWKLLNIQVGVNDICTELCHWKDTEAFLRMEKRMLRETFALLRDNIPRLLINFILMPDIDEIMKVIRKAPQECRGGQRFGCTCFDSYLTTRYYTAVRRMQSDQLKVAQLPEFRTKDFAIIPHSFLRNMTSLFTNDGVMDMHFFSHDCVHYSQLGHAVLAKVLWNSMFEEPDVHRAQLWRDPMKQFLCPNSGQRKYLRTSNDRLQ